LNFSVVPAEKRILTESQRQKGARRISYNSGNRRKDGGKPGIHCFTKSASPLPFGNETQVLKKLECQRRPLKCEEISCN